MFPIPWTSDVCGISTGFSQHALSLEIQVRSAWVPAACCRPTVSLVPGLGSGEAAVVADAFLVTCAHSVTLQMAPLPSPRSVPLQVPHPALLTVLPHPRLSSHPASSPLSLEFTLSLRGEMTQKQIILILSQMALQQHIRPYFSWLIPQLARQE